MKKLLLFILVLSIFSCSKEEQIQDSAVDIELRHEQLTNVPLFLPCDAANLYVLVDLNTCITGSLWECAVEEAINAYNDLPDNIGIGMTVITDINQLPAGETVNINIECAPFFIPGGGRAFPRQTALDVSDIELGFNFENDWPCPDQTPNCCQMQKIVMHEIGHALGFGHTQGGTQNAEWIPGTPMGEANSIFNTSGEDGWCITICDFTEGDLTALEILYPCEASGLEITGDFDLCTNETSTYCIDTELDVQWNLPINSTDNCIEVSSGDWPSSILLNAVVSGEDCCEREYNQVITVHERERCFPPSQAPYDFSEICIGELDPVCYDFSGLGCLETIEIESSNPKLKIEIDDNKVCLLYIWHQPTTIDLDVTFINWCGNEETTTWTINIVDCDGSDF